MLGIQTAGVTPPALLALGFVILPGAALSVAIFGPGRLSLTIRLALLLPMGFAAVAALATVLALMHVLYLGSLLGAYAVLVVGLVFVAARWNGLARQPDALRRDLADEPWAAGVALAVLVGLFVAHLFVPSVLNLGGYTPLRYWSDGLEVATAHRIPALTVQWGRLLPAGTSKMALNAGNGALSLVLGRGPLVPMAAAGAVMTAAAGMAFLALARELALRLTAPLFAVLLVANLRIGNSGPTLDRNFYLAETWGRVVAFAAASLAIRALRSPPGERRLAEALTAGTMLGVASMVHLIPTAVAAALVVAYAAIRAATDGRPRDRVRSGAVTLGVAIALSAGLMLLAPGDSGFQGPGDPDVYARLARDVGLPPSFDPTLFLATGTLEQPQGPTGGAFYRPPSETAERFAGDMLGTADGSAPPWIPLGAAAVALAVVLLLGTADLSIAAGAAIALGGILLGVALAFSHRYRIYALAVFGERRLFDYTAVVGWLVVVPVLEAGLLWLGASPPGIRWRRFRLRSARGQVVVAGDDPSRADVRPTEGVPRPVRRPVRARPVWLPAAAATAVFVVVAAWLVPDSVRSDKIGAQERRLSNILPALAWLEQNVPCTGSVLADRRTLGTFEAVTGRVGVLEGAGPYFRIDVLRVALRTILQAREFLADPARHRDFLTRNHVAAVVLTGPGGGPLGALPVRPVARLRMARAPFLEEALRTSFTTVYRVTTFTAGPGPPADSPFCPSGR